MPLQKRFVYPLASVFLEVGKCGHPAFPKLVLCGLVIAQVGILSLVLFRAIACVTVEVSTVSTMEFPVILGTHEGSEYIKTVILDSSVSKKVSSVSCTGKAKSQKRTFSKRVSTSCPRSLLMLQ